MRLSPQRPACSARLTRLTCIDPNRKWFDAGPVAHGCLTLGMPGSAPCPVPQIGMVVTALDKQVAMIVSDAGWQGPAATAFTQAWDVDAAAATALGVTITSAAQITDQLASTLATIESTLEAAAQQATSNGVPIGPGGQPPQAPLPDPVKESWRQSYQSVWNQAMAAAANARITATTAMQALYAKIAPPGPGAGDGSGGLQPGDDNTLADYLRGFWALPTIYGKEVQEKIDDQNGRVAKAAQELKIDQEALGRFVTANKYIVQDKSNLAEAETKLASLNDQLDTARSNESDVTKGLDFSVSQIPGLNGHDLPGVLKAAADVPFVDVASGGLAAYLGGQQDTADGVPAFVAYPAETASSTASVIGGGSVVSALGALPLAVRVGTGGIVAWGIGDFGHHLIDQPWSSDLGEQDPLQLPSGSVSVPDPVNGAAQGVGNALNQTGQDGWNLLKNTGVGGYHILQGGGKDIQNWADDAANDLNPVNWGL